MALDLNINPYYDDFDEDKNFHQLLFKPGLAVQARELTQLQSILRDQVAKFGNHVFKHGSIVIPGNSFSELNVPYIKLQPTFNSLAIDVTVWEEQIIVGVTSGVEAIVKKAVDLTSTDPIVLYVSYLRGNATTGAVTFVDGEEIYIKTDVTTRANIQASSATGLGSLAYINRGVYYINGNFVLVQKQSAVMSKFSNVPSCYVLLKINEEIVTSDTDQSLLDPSQGSYNFAAPGADRVKISLDLVTLPLTETLTDDYVEVMRYNDGVLEEHAKYSKYSELEKSLARRTHDESGDYVVDGLTSEVRESLKTKNNGGVYSDGDITKLVVDVSPGKAYIKGFEVEKISSTKISIDKARTNDHVKATTFTSRQEFGQYILVSNFVGTLSIYNRQIVELYNDNDPSNVSATKIGEARAMALDYLAGDVTTANAVYKLWITDLTFTGSSYTIEDIGGIRYTGGSAFVNNQYKVRITAGTTGAFTVGEVLNTTSGRKAIARYWDLSTGTLYAYKHDHTAAVPRNGELITGASSNTSGSIENRKLLVTSGKSELVFQLPREIVKTLRDPATNAFDLSYTAQKELTITTNVSGNGSVSVSSGETIDPIELGTFIAIGPAGIVQNSLFSLDGTGVLLTLTGGPASSTVTVYAAVSKTNVSPKTKTVTTTTQVISSPTSVITLDNCDVFELVSVIDSVGDITANYNLFNGQTDYAYTRGKLFLKSGAGTPSGSVTVTYKYYAHSIAGDFFCVDSYPAGVLDQEVNFVSQTSGKKYFLPSCLDFRPTVGTDGTFTGTGSRRNDLIINGTTFSSDLQFYVPRIDVLTVTPSGRIEVIRGTPSENPLPPTVSDGQFLINMFFLPAYTQRVTDVLNRRFDVDRFTMSDIKRIVTRVEKVENFATLSALEMSVTNKNIVDPVTSASKFKTGYLVESFNEPVVLARTTAADFKSTFIQNTTTSSVLVPQMEPLICSLKFLADESSGYVIKNGYLMKSFTEVVFAKQDLSSRTTNLNPFIVIKWDGALAVEPRSDDWVEIRDNPTIFESKQEIIEVKQYVPCPVVETYTPALPPLPKTSYGGIYGFLLGREADQSGINYWVGRFNSGASAIEVAQQFINAAFANVAIGETVNPVFTVGGITPSAAGIAAVGQTGGLTSTTTYSYGAGGSIIATTTGVNLDGTTFTRTNIV